MSEYKGHRYCHDESYNVHLNHLTKKTIITIINTLNSKFALACKTSVGRACVLLEAIMIFRDQTLNPVIKQQSRKCLFPY